ncbi:MAG: glutamate synthase large subunit [Deltaproteobacteria bacterium]|nr:MAG: glutamate synthase large subunit [Deltaproteobacteria bacterium]
MKYGLPEKHGLYDPANEKDACGVGFVAQIKGVASHQIIKDANRILCNMDHRGARGSETNTGDGAGILTAVPDKLLRRVAKEELGIDLPEPGKYGVGNIFLPTDDAERAYCKAAFLRSIETQGQRFLGWRSVPTDPDGANLGPTAAESMPHIEQLFIGAADGLDQDAFERQLYAVRKSAASPLRVDESLKQRTMLYACSLSSRTIIYKGMLACEQVLPFYGDLTDPDYETHLAMVHSRFATNTFPTWERSQPLRCLSHNGEINTLRGNKNAMHSRQGVVEGELFGDDLRKLFPVAEPGLSDSGTLDNVLEFLYMNGRTMAEAAMLMIPEAWQRHEDMPQVKRDFYEYHSCLMEPWDGPASIAFTDGTVIGALLDRNGLRPSRYYLTHDDRVIMASEVGVLPVPPEMVKHKGRLKPGRMFLIDFEQGRMIPDVELKNDIASQRPYGEWLNEQRLKLTELPVNDDAHGFDPETLLSRMQSFGYTTETMQFMLRPMIEQQRDPVGSMGNDSALAVLSDQPRLAYDYFKQLFAQVTNPPIDSIREEVIMAVECYIGPEKNLLTTTPEHAHRLRIPHPILTNEEVNAVKTIDERGWRSKIIDVTWPRSEGAEGLEPAIQRIRQEAEQAVDEGYSLIVLTDRATGKDRIPVSALLATGAAHHHLVATEKRTRVGIVVETGEAREVHHHCCLVGSGADAINPYLAFEALWQERRLGTLDAETFADDDSIVTGYRKAVAKGMLKVFAKMGISTLQSYKGAQIFEAVGLNSSVVDLCFAGTASRIQGIGFNVIAQELVDRHELGYPGEDEPRLPILPNDGQFHWRAKGERHMWNPETIANLQVAARSNSSDAYKRFAEQVNDNARDRATLRGLMRFKKGQGVPLSEVEPASEIVKRFATGAMSFGSISVEAHSTLAIAMNELGGKSNTGEGGEDPERYLPLPDGSMNPMRSAIKQVASGRFGVTINYLTNADELQIKMAQGAKPGEGGELPGRKVDEKIASVRHSTPGVGLISPPPHHDIYSIEDLSQLIHDLKNSNPSARISVKLVSEVGVGTIAAGVSKAHADHILISGHDGGTGASPLTSIKHAGLPWELGISETHQTLVMNDLRSRVVLQTDGQMKTGRDVVIAGLLGAEEIGLSTAPLVAMGCIMMRKCHLNTCPVGVATQDPELRKKFKGKPEHVINYLFMVAEEAREIMASLGFRTFNEMVGRVDMLDTVDAIVHWKAQGIDLTPILTPARKKNAVTVVYYTKPQDHGLDKALDNRLIELAQPAITEGKPVRAELKIKNTNRTVGTMLSHEIAKVWGEELLPDETVRFKFEGSAGQSFGAWLAKGVTLEIEGDANDYVGKGLSGGKIIVYPSKKATFVPAENMIVGNVVLYGAVSGKAFFRGRAAERFCVRNSGAWAVIEGVGDHACEYMTGGRAVILGDTGRNFGAGMSGGVAYVLDTNNDFASKCNQEMVELGRLEYQEEIAIVKGLIEEHFEYTDSAVAERLLQDWDNALRTLVKVMPIDYERVLRQTGDLSVGVPGPDLAQPQDRPAAE